MTLFSKHGPGEGGSVAPLAIGLSLLSLATILMMASATSVFLLQRRLTTLAEFAALSGATSGISARVFLNEADPKGFAGLTIAKDEISDGKTNEVILCANWSPPLPSIVKLGSRIVCSQGAARAG
jgi:hypothetical protein